ncbi:MAG: NAD(P)(+) transhydrogenase (Re/Si-specific) subunit beta, partial [Alphaproteobacteria bacterium]|nr:NAD(P)(+) transhydrogenase (Re/Si-specific) subunit beta [Alphaproteobacteria bacterium]
MTENASAFAYLISSILFIMALRGLSSPTSARQGNMFGIAGMVIAIATTLANPEVVGYGWIILGLLIGGTIGTVIAQKIQMTALPQLVAAFHSLVGLAAVLVASAAFLAPEAYGIGTAGNIPGGSLIEMSLGTAIGAITFTGSIIAFGKLQGLITGKPLVFPGQHFVNLALGVILVGLIVAFANGQSGFIFSLIVLFSLVLGFTLILPIGGADMPVVISMLNSYSGWAA